MGEYAEIAMASAMRRGIPNRPFIPKPGPRAGNVEFRRSREMEPLTA